MTELRIAPHSREDRQIVEVWEDGRMIAVIYPKDRGVKLVSKYLNNSVKLVSLDLAYPPAVHINIWDGQIIDGPAPYERGEEQR